MGTNYYASKEENRCETCGRSDSETLHIGKSSGGWCFSLHVIPDKGLTDLSAWIRYLGQPNVKIRDEYRDSISLEMMFQIIVGRTNGKLTVPEDKLWYRENHAEPGPNGLARHKVDGQHCIGNGEGTWDLCMGEFC